VLTAVIEKQQRPEAPSKATTHRLTTVSVIANGRHHPAAWQSVVQWGFGHLSVLPAAQRFAVEH